jgi:hypothetical protein
MVSGAFPFAVTVIQVLGVLLDVALLAAAVIVAVICAQRAVASAAPWLLAGGVGLGAVLQAVQMWGIYSSWGFELLGDRGVQIAGTILGVLGLGAALLVAYAIATFPRLPAAGGRRG